MENSALCCILRISEERKKRKPSLLMRLRSRPTCQKVQLALNRFCLDFNKLFLSWEKQLYLPWKTTFVTFSVISKELFLNLNLYRFQNGTLLCQKGEDKVYNQGKRASQLCILTSLLIIFH